MPPIRGTVFVVITTRRHPVLARLRAAATGSGDDVLLDGPHLVDEALRSGTRLACLVVATDALRRHEIARLCERARDAGVTVHEATGAAATAISPARTPSGLVALATLTLQPLQALLDAPPPVLLVALVGVQDPGNVGSIIRTAEAAGASGVLTAGGTAHPFSWKAARGSMGSVLRLPIHRATDAVAAVRACREAGVQVLVASSHPAGSAVIRATAPAVLVLGGEGHGVPPEVADLADATLSIALQRGVESLNVSVAAGVLLFELRRARLGTDVLAPDASSPA
jgi:RNA methyltransferase, TrmH family